MHTCTDCGSQIDSAPRCMVCEEIASRASDWPLACSYCGVVDDLRTNCFFSHPVCMACMRVWFSDHPKTVEELRTLSLASRTPALAGVEAREDDGEPNGCAAIERWLDQID